MTFEEIYKEALKESGPMPFDLDFNAEDWDNLEEREIFSTLYNAFEMAKKKMGEKYGHLVLKVAKEVVSELDEIYGPDRTQYADIED